MYKNTHVTTFGSISPLNNIIQTELLSSPNTTNTLDTMVNIDKKSQSFATTQKQKHSATAPSTKNNVSDQVPLESYPHKCKKTQLI